MWMTATLAVVALQGHRGIGLRRTGAQKQCTALRQGREQGKYGAIEGGEAGLRGVMLHGPEAGVVLPEHTGIMLCGTQLQDDVTRVYLHDMRPRHPATAHVGFLAFGIRIKYHDVALAEIGQVVVVLLGASQEQEVHAAVPLSLIQAPRTHDVQSGKEVPGHQTFLGTAVPERGHAAGFARGRTDF